MAKEDLLFILKRLLQTDAYLEFLLQIDETELRTLIACIRDRIDRENNKRISKKRKTSMKLLYHITGEFDPQRRRDQCETNLPHVY